jgi:Zn-dependent protease
MTRTCKSCSYELAPELLACPQCHTLVHAGQLEQLAATAKTLEAQHQFLQARDHWLKALPLLPPQSTQADWIRDNARKLELAAAQSGPQESRSKWANKLGPLAPIALILAKGKTLFLAIFKLKFLLSLGAFMAFYWTLYGAKFGVGFAVLILIHEMGHFIDIKRRGLPAEMPVFLPGLGAYVRWQALGVSRQTRAAISLAGPLAGWIASVICAVVWWKTGNSLWAALARAGAWLNILNLIPVWILDGGQAVLVLNKGERIALVTTCIALSFVLGESVFFLVAAGAAWRLFTKDIPEESNRAITAYFIGVLASLGFVMWLMPGQGFGGR